MAVKIVVFDPLNRAEVDLAEIQLSQLLAANWQIVASCSGSGNTGTQVVLTLYNPMENLTDAPQRGRTPVPASDNPNDFRPTDLPGHY